jgi:topoisomerase IV subunit B
VRLRPGMYIGSTGTRGLHHLVYEIVDNAVDEALAGHCNQIDVRVETDNVVFVRDNGRGIPVGMHPEEKIPTPEVVFTKLHAGGKFGGDGYKVSGGLHGVGASVVNALSNYLEVEICRDSRSYIQRYERGEPVTTLEEKGATRRRGTTVRFRPDDTIFSTVEFNVKTLSSRLRELAFLNPGVKFTLKDARRPADLTSAHEPFDETYDYQDGVLDFLKYLNEGHGVLHEPIVFAGQAGDLEVNVAFQYNDGYTESLNSFVNCISTFEGGQHETGFRVAHTRVLNEYARKLGVWKKKGTLSGDDLREGLMCVLSVRMTGPEFEGQTKTKLGNPEARQAVELIVQQHMTAFMEEHPKSAKMLLEKAARANSARSAARKARDAARSGKSGKGRTSLDGKLTRCASRKVELNELFIVEGDSAGGSAKQARDRMHQAILPLKGKPLNTEKATLAKVLANKEILAIVQSVGAGIGGEFEIGSINYGRVVILADADDDGAHIRCLLLTFFYRFMRPLVSSGHVYIAQPPLFKLERSGKKKEVRYAWSQGELEAILQKWGRKAVIQRFKGLGEMDPLQLWETTMNPATRTLVRVTIEDAAQAERQVHTLMGNKADLRKKWISENVRFGDMADRDVDDIDEVENDGSSDMFDEEEANESSPTNEGATQELDA